MTLSCQVERGLGMASGVGTWVYTEGYLCNLSQAIGCHVEDNLASDSFALIWLLMITLEMVLPYDSDKEFKLGWIAPNDVLANFSLFLHLIYCVLLDRNYSSLPNWSGLRNETSSELMAQCETRIWIDDESSHHKILKTINSVGSMLKASFWFRVYARNPTWTPFSMQNTLNLPTMRVCPDSPLHLSQYPCLASDFGP